jgi:hypothetical protein
MSKLTGLGAFFAALCAAQNRAIRSNFCPSGAKIPLLSLALREALRSPAEKTHNSNAVAIVGPYQGAKAGKVRQLRGFSLIKGFLE